MSHPVNSTAPKGDVILIMNIMPDPEMIVTNGDIWIDYNLPFYDMILGGDFEVSTKVNSVKVKVPKGSYDGKILRILGMGLIYNKNHNGNLMIKLRAATVDLSENS